MSLVIVVVRGEAVFENEAPLLPGVDVIKAFADKVNIIITIPAATRFDSLPLKNGAVCSIVSRQRRGKFIMTILRDGDEEPSTSGATITNNISIIDKAVNALVNPIIYIMPTSINRTKAKAYSGLIPP